MNTIFEMPSWKTGIFKRLRQITAAQILEVVLGVLFVAMLIFMLVMPIIFALYTPPTVDFNF